MDIRSFVLVPMFLSSGCYNAAVQVPADASESDQARFVYTLSLPVDFPAAHAEDYSVLAEGVPLPLAETPSGPAHQFEGVIAKSGRRAGLVPALPEVVDARSGQLLARGELPTNPCLRPEPNSIGASTDAQLDALVLFEFFQVLRYDEAANDGEGSAWQVLTNLGRCTYTNPEWFYNFAP